MTTGRARRGSIIVGPLVGATLGLIVLAGVTVALAQATSWVRRANRRAEVEDAADLVAQTLAFDIRSSGWDPAGTSGARLVQASPSALEVLVDRDGDGAIDTASAERVRWRWTPGTRTLSRQVGRQSMPLADTIVRAAFEYRDATGSALVAPAPGLSASDLVRVRSVGLSFAVSAPDGGIVVERAVAVALRGGLP
jgi:Tfp pilus assembly protein PilW